MAGGERELNFSLFSFFSYSKFESHNFQAFHMLEQEPEVGTAYFRCLHFCGLYPSLMATVVLKWTDKHRSFIVTIQVDSDEAGT